MWLWRIIRSLINKLIMNRKEREELKELLGYMLFAFIFIMFNILGVYIIFADKF